MSFIQPFSNLYQSYPLFNQENWLSLSKQRIIQKNLVHFQGFPDSFYNENLLTSPEYLGQYGNIEKILLVSKEQPASIFAGSKSAHRSDALCQQSYVRALDRP